MNNEIILHNLIDVDTQLLHIKTQKMVTKVRQVSESTRRVTAIT